MPMVVSQLIVNAAVKLGVTRWGGTLEPGVAAGMLGVLNDIIDTWNVNPLASFTVAFTQYTPTLGQDYQTIGPSSADWTVDPRPTKILAANVILNTSTPNVRVPISISDSIWWQNQAVPQLETAWPTNLYYDPRWALDGNGRVYLWPIPTTAYPIELKTDQKFAGYASSDTLWLPPGYRNLLQCELAVETASALGQMVPPSLEQSYRKAQALVFGNNVSVRNARTRDGGMPGRQSGRAYIYRTGLMKNGN